jgi:hypothetical protein
MGRKFKFYASTASLAEKRELVLLSESIFESLGTDLSSLSAHQTDSFGAAVASLLSALYLDLGFASALCSLLSALLIVCPLSLLHGQVVFIKLRHGSVDLSRPLPLIEPLLERGLCGLSSAHSSLLMDRVATLFTISQWPQTTRQSSRPSFALHNWPALTSRSALPARPLLRGARQVLGLGKDYQTYAQKIEWYHEEIVAGSPHIADSDLIVMVDAYDVIFTPAVRQFGKVFPPTVSMSLLTSQKMARASAPMVACAEKGVYPERSSPWLYFQDALSATSRFLNSGCLIGRAGQVRWSPPSRLLRSPSLRSRLSWGRSCRRCASSATTSRSLSGSSSATRTSWRSTTPTPSSNADTKSLRRMSGQCSPFLCFSAHLPSLPHSPCLRPSLPVSIRGILTNGSVYFKGSSHPVGLFHCNNRVSLPLYETYRTVLATRSADPSSVSCSSIAGTQRPFSTAPRVCFCWKV